ncbi:MAG: Rieske 2Fe-2S domain-containing protein [Methylocella sp.]
MRVEVEGHGVVLARTGSEVHACEGLCPHEKADLSSGRVDSGRLVCPRHLASFSLREGSVSAGWKVEALRLYPVRIVDGEIAIDAEAVGRSPPGGAKMVWDFT